MKLYQVVTLELAGYDMINYASNDVHLEREEAEQKIKALQRINPELWALATIKELNLEV